MCIHHHLLSVSLRRESLNLVSTSHHQIHPSILLARSLVKDDKEGHNLIQHLQYKPSIAIAVIEIAWFQYLKKDYLAKEQSLDQIVTLCIHRQREMVAIGCQAIINIVP